VMRAALVEKFILKAQIMQRDEKTRKRVNAH